MKSRKVVDGVPTRLYGVKRGAVSVVKFIQKCCDCGLRHNVEIKHSGKCPEIDITFDRIDEKNED